jgi:pyrroloquinoline quinone biosynthesis protein B
MLAALLATAAAAPFAVVLGIAQDAGVPQAGCDNDCCRAAWADPARRQHPASLGLVDPETQQRWVLDVTPAFPDQLRLLSQHTPWAAGGPPDGVLLTHAHIGHYAGLVHLGREVMGARGVQVYAMPRMAAFLTEHGPWSQLVQLGNVSLVPVSAGSPLALSPSLQVTALVVPHRDEFSETVGWVVKGPERSLLWLPDIDKWSRWERDLAQVLATVDVAYVDATFFDGAELPGRDMAEIPHPFIIETMALAEGLPAAERAKIRLVHLNHSNPALWAGSAARQRLEAAGLRVAEPGVVEAL